MKNSALNTATQALTLTSQLLAISIEIGIIAGGYYIYKKVNEPCVKHEADAVLVPDGYELVPVEKKPTLKEKWQKAKKIIKAVVS